MAGLKIIIPVCCAFLLASCSNEKNEDITETVNRSGAVETSIQVEHLDSTKDVLVTLHKVWVKNNLYRELQYRDTIPTLGTESAVAENSNQPVQIPKDYEIFITIK